VASGKDLPETISEDEYNKVRLNKENYPAWYVGLVGFCSTFGSKYFGGYARGNDAKGNKRDLPNEAIRNICCQQPQLKNCIFINKDYLSLDKPKIKNFLIYCDPPYENSTKYSTIKFDYVAFWNWVREMSLSNIVLISEYNAPEDFECIWQKDVTTSLKVNERENRTEKLFIIKK
jgi:site-specific DNA-adenine methylase